MVRAVAFALLAASMLAGSLEAQRGGGAFHGHAVGLAGRSGFVGHGAASNGFSPGLGFTPGLGFLPNTGFFPGRGFFPNRFRHRQNGFGGFFAPFFFPDYWPYWYEQPYAEVASEPAPVVIIQRPDEGQPRAPETPPAKPQVIEIPAIEDSTATQKALPTIFVLANGERLETARFVLTASRLSVTVDRHERTIPADMLDINATIAANRERQINLSIPVDRNEISLSF